LLQYVDSVDEAASRDISVRGGKGCVERRSVGVVEPVARIKREQFNLGAFGQIGGLIHYKAAGPHASLDRHTESA
jgi:hypothetical protein